MLTVLRRELLGWLRRPASVVWATLLHVGLLLFVVSFWPSGVQPDDPTWLARLVIYDFFEKVLLLLLVVTPVVTASSFAAEHERATFHLLRLTRLRPLEIVGGKLFSGVGYMLILLLSTLPYLTILLGMGGVSARAVVVLYVLLATTIVYSGLLGQYVALRVKGRVRAVVAAIALVLVVNMVLPSVQLSLQYYELVRTGRIPVRALRAPASEELFSTPQREVFHFYLIDLLSPYSVYLNFRHVQLGELTPRPFVDYDRQPASDFGMIYHHWGLMALLLPLLALMAARRLERLQPREVASASHAREGLWGRVPVRPAIAAFATSLLAGYTFAVFLNVILGEESPPRRVTLLMMLAAGALVGTGAADPISRDRDRGTLRLHVLTGMSARRYLARCARPTLGLLVAALSGYATGLLLPWLEPALPEGIEPLSLERVAMSLLCIVGLAALATGAGLFFSVVCRTTLGARVGVVFVVLFLFIHWKLGAPYDMSAFEVIERSDYGPLLKAVFTAVAWTKLVVATLTHFINPFVILSACFETSGLPAGAGDLGVPDLVATSLVATPLLIVATTGALLLLTHRLLVRRHHFVP